MFELDEADTGLGACSQETKEAIGVGMASQKTTGDPNSRSRSREFGGLVPQEITEATCVAVVFFCLVRLVHAWAIATRFCVHDDALGRDDIRLDAYRGGSWRIHYTGCTNRLGDDFIVYQ